MSNEDYDGKQALDFKVRILLPNLGVLSRFKCSSFQFGKFRLPLNLPASRHRWESLSSPYLASSLALHLFLDK